MAHTISSVRLSMPTYVDYILMSKVIQQYMDDTAEEGLSLLAVLSYEEAARSISINHLLLDMDEILDMLNMIVEVMLEVASDRAANEPKKAKAAMDFSFDAFGRCFYTDTNIVHDFEIRRKDHRLEYRETELYRYLHKDIGISLRKALEALKDDVTRVPPEEEFKKADTFCYVKGNGIYLEHPPFGEWKTVSTQSACEKEPTIQLSQLEERIVQFVKDKGTLAPRWEIVVECIDSPEKEVRAALDNLCEKGILFGGAQITGNLYGIVDDGNKRDSTEDDLKFSEPLSLAEGAGITIDCSPFEKWTPAIAHQPSEPESNGNKLYQWTFEQGGIARGNDWSISVPDGFVSISSAEGRAFELVPKGYENAEDSARPLVILPGKSAPGIIPDEYWMHHPYARAGIAEVTGRQQAEVSLRMMSAFTGKKESISDILSVGFADICAFVLVMDTDNGTYSYQCSVITEDSAQMLRIQTQQISTEQRRSLNSSVLAWLRTFRFNKKNSLYPSDAPFDATKIITELKSGTTAAFDQAIEKAQQECGIAANGRFESLRYLAQNGNTPDDVESRIEKIFRDEMEIREFYYCKANDLISKLGSEHLDSNLWGKLYHKLADLGSIKKEYELNGKQYAVYDSERTKSIKENWAKEENKRRAEALSSSPISKKSTIHKPIGVPDSEVIHFLQEKGEKTLTDIAEYLGLPYQDTSEVLNELRKRGKVKRDNKCSPPVYSLGNETIYEMQRQIDEKQKNHVAERFTPEEEEALTFIRDNGPCCCLDVANHMGKSLHIASTILSSLREKGQINRTYLEKTPMYSVDEEEYLKSHYSVEQREALKRWEVECQSVAKQRNAYIEQQLADEQKRAEDSARDKKKKAIDTMNAIIEDQQNRKNEAARLLATQGLFGGSKKKELKARIEDAEMKINNAQEKLEEAYTTYTRETQKISQDSEKMRKTYEAIAEMKYPMPSKPIK